MSSINEHVAIEVMGTVVTIDLVIDEHCDSAAVEAAVVTAAHRLHEIDARFSTWKDDSEITLLRQGSLGLADVSDEVRMVLRLCEELRRATGGWFDPWAMPGGVDPTGIVKGWAATQALSALVIDGVTGAMVNAAGDICVTGHPHGTDPYRNGLVNPFSFATLMGVVEITGAVATSETYERGAHLVDPFTATPQARAASATVTGPDLTIADGLATALCVGGPDQLSMLDLLDDCNALVITFDREVIATSGFPLVGNVDLSGEVLRP